jgi:hypothetical protein
MGAVLCLVILILVNVFIIVFVNEGPVVLRTGTGHGVHALDVVTLALTLPFCVRLGRCLNRQWRRG